MKECLKFGAGRPLGTVWVMERTYFEFRRKYPGISEYAYLRLSLQSRYPSKQGNELGELLSDCRNLDDVVLRAIALDFGVHVAAQMCMNVLYNLPLCVICGKYRAMSLTDNLCYGCRKYPQFSACTSCHLYWDIPINFCQSCGGPLWRITDGPGVITSTMGSTPDFPSETATPLPLPNVSEQDPLSDESKEVQDSPIGADDLEWVYCENCNRYWNPGQDHCPQCGGKLTRESDKATLVWLAAEIGPLNERCAEMYEGSLSQRREHRLRRKEEPEAARAYLAEQELPVKERKNAEQDLLKDIDSFLDSLCHYYLGADDEERKLVRDLMGKHKYLLGNLLGYIARKTQRLKLGGTGGLLALGLAAVAINDGRDVRDYDSLVGDLYAAAVAKGIDPTSYLKMAAGISNPEGTPSTRDFLLNFKPSSSFGPLYMAKNQESTFVKEASQKKTGSDLENSIGGTARKLALELFLKACNKRDTLFITDEWIAPRLEQLRVLLSDPITEQQAAALKDVVFKRSKIDDLIEWLNYPREPWTAFDRQRKHAVLEEKKLKEDTEKREYEKRYVESEKAWRSRGRTPEEAAKNDLELQSKHSQEEAKRTYLGKANRCPQCGLAPDKLAWFYFITPLTPYELKSLLLHGSGGWMTFCDNCGVSVDFFVEERRYF